MADTEYSQEEITAFDEAGRAYERFKNVLDVHGAAIITFETYPRCQPLMTPFPRVFACEVG